VFPSSDGKIQVTLLSYVLSAIINGQFGLEVLNLLFISQMFSIICNCSLTVANRSFTL
jgi:hypothetical protein